MLIYSDIWQKREFGEVDRTSQFCNEKSGNATHTCSAQSRVETPWWQHDLAQPLLGLRSKLLGPECQIEIGAWNAGTIWESDPRWPKGVERQRQRCLRLSWGVEPLAANDRDGLMNVVKALYLRGTEGGNWGQVLVLAQECFHCFLSTLN